jgi:hypothetical protein
MRMAAAVMLDGLGVSEQQFPLLKYHLPLSLLN